MIKDFSKSKFERKYGFESPRSLVRIMSDAFSRQHCDTNGALKHAAESTEGRCLYCGKPLYSLMDKGDIPEFPRTIHFDHIYPASNLNLFAVGNVALACETCNLEKSNTMPEDYYDMRRLTGKSLLIYDREEFLHFLEEMTSQYRKNWPKHYKVGISNIDEKDYKRLLTELLYEDIDVSSAANKYNHENSLNWPIWQKVVKRAEIYYSKATVKDVEARIGYTNDFFENEFGVDRKLEDCTLSELGGFTNKLLLSKYESENEISKYRMLIKMLTEVLNEEYMGGKLDNFYKGVPTWSVIRDTKEELEEENSNEDWYKQLQSES